jgi:hypothetical protein
VRLPFSAFTSPQPSFRSFSSPGKITLPEIFTAKPYLGIVIDHSRRPLQRALEEKEGKMKKNGKMFLALGLMVVFAMAVYAQVAAQKVDRTKLIKQPVNVGIIKPCEGPDLVAGRPTIVKQIISGKGYLNLSAKVMNQGTKDFISNPSQAEAQLYVKKLWMSGPASYVYIQKVPIARLNKGQEINLSGRFEMPYFEKWDCADIVAGYCCQEVQVIVAISWDPDIRMDGNLDNDDCRASNDRCYDAPAHHVWYQVQCPW